MATISGFVPHNRPAKPRKSKFLKQVAPPAADGETAAAVEPKTEVPAPGKTGPLARLPGEIRRMIFSSLDYHSLIRLSTTCRFFHRTVVPQTLADPLEMLQFVGRAMNFPQHWPKERGSNPHPGNFECYICFRIRSPDLFDANQAQHAIIDEQGYVVKGDVSPFSKVMGVYLRRFCIECGLLTGLHAPSDSLTTKTGGEFWVCKCRKLWPRPDVLKCSVCCDTCPFRLRKHGLQLASKVPEAAALA
ncbi:unnamed protein product [Clonostachys rhizophaga]|uniref:F-box domain-containing protein n=1 Tax=Clonostachys rhizophaga TaxID=160324 RepID=A0A9N9VZ02_9HYPO|nr:unnamed protein product [Clonostachys rhizophaga]